MPIESQCTGCGKLLRVADEFAGRRARCPVCQNIYTVPAAETAGSGAWTSSAESSEYGGARSDSVDDEHSASERWYLQAHSGQVYGPVDRRELESWVAEGRVDSKCQVRNNQQSGWIPADVVFPVLRSGRATPYSESFPLGAAHSATSAGYSEQDYRTQMMPHRGPLILILGLCSWFFSCPLFGAVSWYMGSQDLREIGAGRRDPQGESLTRAGQILGMVHVILVGALFALLILMFVLAILGSL